MKKRRHNSGLVSDVGSMVVGGATIGVGSQALHTAFGTDYGVSEAGSFMPMMGTMVGAKHTMKAVKKLRFK
jgi:hypothetical protein